MGDFRNLRVWQEAKQLAVDIYKVTSEGQLKDDFGLKNQMRRSAVSIPSNIAEGDELGSNKQAVHFFYHARGSSAELRTQLIIANEIGYISSEALETLEDRCSKIGAMLNRLIVSRK